MEKSLSFDGIDENTKGSSHSSGYGTDFPDVSNLDDVIDAMDLCDQYDVPYEGLDDIEDFVERLRLHFMKERGHESRKQTTGLKCWIFLKVLIMDVMLNLIHSLENLYEAVDFADTYGINIGELNSLDELKSRFKLHVENLHEQGFKAKIEKSIQKAGKNDRNRREKLISVMKEMLDILHREGDETVQAKSRSSAFVESLLQREGTCQDLAMDCKAKINMIHNNACYIIVAGETSAGKSSVLNLLFEDELLPVHNNSSTSVITLVKYSRRKHARVVYKTNLPDVEFDLDQDGLEKLHSIAFMKSASEREHHTVKEVHVYLPLPLLKSGLVLVDTPGIGENEFLENELIDFISQNDILGFMYIIKTDNAGGVQEDRLLNLLKIVVQKQKSRNNDGESQMKFDPKAALFVCNRFDLVNKSELDKVKQNALDKLSECWPSFDKSQMLFFSTERAKRDIVADTEYINDNYKEFLEALRDLYVTSMERRIKFSYQWIENVLKRLVHHLKSMLKQLDSTDMELKEKSELVRQKLEKLHDQSENVISELTNNVFSESKDLIEVLRDYFKKPHCKQRLTTGWTLDEVPKVDSGLGDWSWIKMKIQEAFFDRLSKIVTEWDKKEKRLECIEIDMSCLVKLKLKLLENDLIEIEKQIQGDSSTESSDSLSRLSRSRRRTGSLGLGSPQKADIQLNHPRLPNRLAGRLMKPLANVIYNLKNNVKLGDYRKNPLVVAEGLAKEFYKDLIDNADRTDSNLSLFVDVLMERPREYIAALGRKIPDMILSNQLLLNRFQETLGDERKNQSVYEQMMAGIEGLRRSLTEYGEGYIFVDDFANGEIRIQKATSDGGSVSVAFNASDFLRNSTDQLEASRIRDIRGLWTVTYSGLLVRNEDEKAIAMRVYLPSSGVQYTFKEVAKLRCLTWQMTNIAEFLGIHNADTGTPAFIYASGLTSVRRSLNSFCNKRDCVPLILEQTAFGLDYLHNKGLVHMELSQDTVTLDDEGDVRLSGACLPRKARLPEYTESTETGSFVYLSPEVLRGDLYEATADIYAYGLLVLELAQVDTPIAFVSERRKPLSDFIENVNPETMLNLERTVDIFTIKTRTLIQNCLEMDKLERPVMSEVVEYSRFIKSERDALGRLPSRRSRGIIKKPSRESRISTHL